MGIDYSGMMIIGVDYEELPEHIQEIEDIYEWADKEGLDIASLWYDAGTDGMIIGKSIEDVSEEDFDEWTIKVKQMFKEVELILGVKPKLIGTQDIY